MGLLERLLGKRKDVTISFKFNVEINGIIEASFTECSGLGMEREVYTYEEGGVNDYVHKLPGRTKYTNVVLKRGQTDSFELWNWYQKGIRDGNIERRHVSIILYQRDGSVARRWNLRGAYPVKWTAPAFKTDSNQAAIETLELAHHGIS